MMMLSMGEYDCSLALENDYMKKRNERTSERFEHLRYHCLYHLSDILVFSEGPVFWQRMVRTVNWKNHNDDQYERSKRKE
jgi:hypothetical protein